MKNKRRLITIILFSVLVIGMFFMFKKEEIVILDDVIIKEVNNNVSFAMYIENSEGVYERVVNTNIFPEANDDIDLDLDMSKCTDREGKEIEDALDYDYVNKRVIVETDKETFCYLYFGIALPIGTEFLFDFKGSEEVFSVPKTGNYKIELWGAQGGTMSAGGYTATGGYGGYSVGVARLKRNSNLYVNVGQTGAYNVLDIYNAGTQHSYTGAWSMYSATSGGATHVATISGVLKDLEQYKGTLNQTEEYYISDVIIEVAAGGGGGNVYTWNGVRAGHGGAGGGFKGNQGVGYSYDTSLNRVGTQTSGDGFGGDYGGAGFYSGGNGGFADGPGTFGKGGGSSYIASSMLKSNESITKHMTCYNCTVSDEEQIKTISNTCVSENPIEDCAKTGNGYAKITYIGNK